MSRKHYRNDPRVITARFDGVCPDTGKRIRRGDECLYYPAFKRVYALDSETAIEYRGWRFDIEVLGVE